MPTYRTFLFGNLPVEVEIDKAGSILSVEANPDSKEKCFLEIDGVTFSDGNNYPEDSLSFQETQYDNIRACLESQPSPATIAACERADVHRKES